MSATRRVLVVEDNPDDAELTLFALRASAPSLQIDIAADGVQALARLGADGDELPAMLPALVLLDLKMPRMDGLAVLGAIRRHAALAAVPVVILTSSREPGDVAAAYQSGVNAYIVKSMEFDRFVEAIDAARRFWIGVNELP